MQMRLRTRRVPGAISQVSVRVALIATFTGLSLGTNYALTAFPNVKLMDTFDFLATYAFGFSVGFPTIILTRLIYASVNPIGSASAFLILFLVVGDCFYGFAALIARRLELLKNFSEKGDQSISIGVLGLFSALSFDLLTNFQYGLTAVTGSSIPTYLTRAFILGVITMNFPLPMGVFHEVSDFIFFATIAPSALLVLKRSRILSLGPISRLATKELTSI
jgi:hypothetical protein